LRTRRSPAVFFAGLLTVVASVHYGVPLLSSAIAYAPGMTLGTNTRLTLLLVFALSALGAFGLDVALRAEPAALRRAFTVVRAWTLALLAAGVLAVWLAGGDPRAALVAPPLFAQYVAYAIGLAAAALLLLRWLGSGDARWGAALAGVQVLSLAPLAATYWPVHDTAWLYPTPPAIAWLRQHAPADRVMIADTVGLLYELRQAHGYDGLTPRRIEDLAGPIGTARPRLDGLLENTLRLHGSEPLSPLAVLLAPTRPVLGVRRLVLAPGTVPPEAGLRLVYDGADARIFEDPGALPRAFVATGARCADDRTALHLLRTRAVDSAHEVLLAGCDAPPRAGAPATRGEARIVEESTGRVRVSASADGGAWLVLGDTWFPGWRARLDGVDAPIWRANHAFRAVALPPGRHEIEFTFVPRGLFVGMALSVGAALGIVVLLLPWPAAAAPTVATVGAAVIVLGASPAALAALPAPPFELSLMPATVNGGGSVTVSVTPHGAAAGRPLDAYIVWLDSERAAFLQPDGRWSPRPVPWRAGLQAHERADGVWPGAGPPGSITLALVVVEPGGDPLDRGGWRFRPALATLQVAGPPVQRAWDQVVVPVVVAALSALLVIGWPLPRPPRV
jgi:membrane protein YfhO